MPNAARILLIELDEDLSGELITALENEGTQDASRQELYPSRGTSPFTPVRRHCE